MANPRSTTRTRAMHVVVAPGSPADATFRRRREAHAAALAPGMPPETQLNLKDFAGRTIRDLAYVNYFVADPDGWDPGDVQNIDSALRSAMTDTNLNNMLAQYYSGTPPTAAAKPRRSLSQTVPTTVFKDTVEGIVTNLHADGSLSDLDLQSTVLNLMLPPGTILHSGDSTGAEEDDRAPQFDEDEADSTQGLGGYHGSIHPTSGETVYYAVGVFSRTNPDGTDNGIVAFDQPWKNVVATFYHELQEARTDPDVGDAAHTGEETFLGWYSLAHLGGEIGDIPINEVGAMHMPLQEVFKEVTLTGADATVPIQLMWSNADGGPAVGTPTPTEGAASR